MVRGEQTGWVRLEFSNVGLEKERKLILQFGRMEYDIFLELEYLSG